MNQARVELHNQHMIGADKFTNSRFLPYVIQKNPGLTLESLMMLLQAEAAGRQGRAAATNRVYIKSLLNEGVRTGTLLSVKFQNYTHYFRDLTGVQNFMSLYEKMNDLLGMLIHSKITDQTVQRDIMHKVNSDWVDLHISLPTWNGKFLVVDVDGW